MHKEEDGWQQVMLVSHDADIAAAAAHMWDCANQHSCVNTHSFMRSHARVVFDRRVAKRRLTQDHRQSEESVQARAGRILTTRIY